MSAPQLGWSEYGNQAASFNVNRTNAPAPLIPDRMNDNAVA